MLAKILVGGEEKKKRGNEAGKVNRRYLVPRLDHLLRL